MSIKNGVCLKFVTARFGILMGKLFSLLLWQLLGIRKSHWIRSGSASLVVNRLKICLRNSPKQHTFHHHHFSHQPPFPLHTVALQFRSDVMLCFVRSWPVFYCAFTCFIWLAYTESSASHGAWASNGAPNNIAHSLSFVSPGFVSLSENISASVHFG